MTPQFILPVAAVYLIVGRLFSHSWLCYSFGEETPLTPAINRPIDPPIERTGNKNCHRDNDTMPRITFEPNTVTLSKNQITR